LRSFFAGLDFWLRRQRINTSHHRFAANTAEPERSPSPDILK
jgi:hypothetical protein